MTNQTKLDKLTAKMPTLLAAQAKREAQQQQRLTYTLARLEALPDDKYSELVELYYKHPASLYVKQYMYGYSGSWHWSSIETYTSNSDINQAKQEREVILYQLMINKQLIKRTRKAA